IPIHPVAKNQSQRGVRLGGLWLDFSGFERRRIGLRKSLRRRAEAVPGEATIAVRQSRVGCAVRRISVYCLLKVNYGPLQAVSGPLVPEIAALEISVICLRI